MLVANAPMRWSSKLAARAAVAQPLLAADGGANHLARLGLRPAAVIGDLDSISDATRTWVGDGRLIHRLDQDLTDLEKAIEYAFDELNVRSLTVLAALGGRTDHDLGNLGLLARLAMGERLRYETEEQTVLAVAGEVGLTATPGETWSFWTYDPAVRVSLEGVRWPLDNAEISAGTTPSISNEAVESYVSINALGGSVIVLRHLDSSSDR